jgi:hypothetical protein
VNSGLVTVAAKIPLWGGGDCRTICPVPCYQKNFQTKDESGGSYAHTLSFGYFASSRSSAVLHSEYRLGFERRVDYL